MYIYIYVLVLVLLVQAFVQKVVSRNSLGNICLNLNPSCDQQKPVVKAICLRRFWLLFWKDGICLVFVRPFKSYLVYAAVCGPQHHVTHRGPPTTAGVCGWPVTWPPGAPVVAELDPQWHLSEKLLLQGSFRVGWELDRMGWHGWANVEEKQTKNLVVWVVGLVIFLL